MKINLNLEQRKSLSEFLNAIAAGWFSALFIVPNINPHVAWLTYIIYIVNIMLALTGSLVLLKEKI